MTDVDFFLLPAEVRDGLNLARARDRRATGGRLRVQMGETWYPVTSCDATGFDVPLSALAGSPALRGLVEIHEGPRMIRSVLVVAVASSNGSMRYEFKRTTAPRTRAPLDYESASDLPVGFLARGATE